MKPNLARNVRKLNRQTQDLLAELESWSQERLSFRLSGETWSTLDLLEHLRLTEAVMLATMRRHLPAGNRVTLGDRLRSARILGIMLLPMRVKVPDTAKSILPAGTPKDLSVLRQEWTSDRRALTSFLESLSTGDQERGVFRHPFGGWTTPSGAVLFLRSHLRHHGYQLARLRRSSQ